VALQIRYSVKSRGVRELTDLVMMESRKRLRAAGEYVKDKVIGFSKRWLKLWNAYVPALRQVIKKTVFLRTDYNKVIPVKPDRREIYTKTGNLRYWLERPEVKSSYFGDKVEVRWHLPGNKKKHGSL